MTANAGDSSKLRRPARRLAKKAARNTVVANSNLLRTLEGLFLSLTDGKFKAQWKATFVMRDCTQTPPHIFYPHIDEQYWR